MSGAWGDDMVDLDREPEPQDHLWHEKIFDSMKINCCMRCGFIKNENKPNKPCLGWVRVGLREKA